MTNPNETDLRIIGGKYRGSKLAYHGDPVTRPMKPPRAGSHL